MIRAADQFGPWAPGLDRAERVGRLRTLRAVVRLTTGPRWQSTADLFHLAELDPDTLRCALNAMASKVGDLRQQRRRPGTNRPERSIVAAV